MEETWKKNQKNKNRKKAVNVLKNHFNSFFENCALA